MTNLSGPVDAITASCRVAASEPLETATAATMNSRVLHRKRRVHRPRLHARAPSSACCSGGVTQPQGLMTVASPSMCYAVAE